jgi:hypothetical protein
MPASGSITRTNNSHSGTGLAINSPISSVISPSNPTVGPSTSSIIPLGSGIDPQAWLATLLVKLNQAVFSDIGKVCSPQVILLSILIPFALFIRFIYFTEKYLHFCWLLEFNTRQATLAMQSGMLFLLLRRLMLLPINNLLVPPIRWRPCYYPFQHSSHQPLHPHPPSPLCHKNWKELCRGIE